MNRRRRLEREVSLAKKRIDEAPNDTPSDIKDLWEKEYIGLSFDLNNLVDQEDDNNDD